MADNRGTKRMSVELNEDGESYYMKEGKNHKKVKIEGYLPGDDDIGLSLSHINFLKRKLVDYSQVDGRGLEEHLYEPFDYTLQQYIAILKSERKTKKGIHAFNEVFYISKLEEPMYTYVIPEIREIIRGMISFVLYMHSKEVTFRDAFELKLKHFCVSNGIVQFWMIQFQNSKTHNNRQRDFYQIANIIKSELLNNVHLEECMRDLIGGMLNYHEKATPVGSSSTQNEILTEGYFGVHIALMSRSERLLYIKNCYDKLDGLGTFENSEYEEAILDMMCEDGWIDRVDKGFNYMKDSLFNEYIKVTSKTQLGRAPNPKPKMVEDLRKFYQDKVDSYGDPFYKNKALIRMCRNVATHLYTSAREEANKGNRTSMDENIDDIWIDAPIMKLFEVDLMDFQYALYKRNILRYFMS